MLLLFIYFKKKVFKKIVIFLGFLAQCIYFALENCKKVIINKLIQKIWGKTTKTERRFFLLNTLCTVSDACTPKSFSLFFLLISNVVQYFPTVDHSICPQVYLIHIQTINLQHFWSFLSFLPFQPGWMDGTVGYSFRPF